MGYLGACWKRGWPSRGHGVLAHLPSFSYLPHHDKCAPAQSLALPFVWQLPASKVCGWCSVIRAFKPLLS